MRELVLTAAVTGAADAAGNVPRTPPVAAGDFPVGSFQQNARVGSGAYSESEGAGVSCSLRAPIAAVSGSVHLGAASSAMGGRVSGTFEIALSDGRTLRGSFSAAVKATLL